MKHCKSDCKDGEADAPRVPRETSAAGALWAVYALAIGALLSWAWHAWGAQ